jgi:hypothetical protein
MPSPLDSALVVHEGEKIDPKWESIFLTQLSLWAGKTLAPMVQPGVKDWVQRRQSKWLNSAYKFVGGGLWLGSQIFKVWLDTKVRYNSFQNHQILEALQAKLLHEKH